MPRPTFTALLALLAALALSAPALAGPPERPSGQMALDEVAEGLRRYKLEGNPARRAAWLRRLAPARDARVAVALGTALGDAVPEVRSAAVAGLLAHHIEPAALLAGPPARRTDEEEALYWWANHAAELRRRAKLLPR
jgi:hypothetical protein